MAENKGLFCYECKTVIMPIEALTSSHITTVDQLEQSTHSHTHKQTNTYSYAHAQRGINMPQVVLTWHGGMFVCLCSKKKCAYLLGGCCLCVSGTAG